VFAVRLPLAGPDSARPNERSRMKRHRNPRLFQDPQLKSSTSQAFRIIVLLALAFLASE
jgi:hypothetical protein